MKVCKWLLVFFASLACCCVIWAGYNIATDPFGVFGDRLFDWYDYNMTMNPRVAKITYLNSRFDQYDSYVLGSSKASSLPVPELNQYCDASFYNMTWYGGDLKDERDTLRYLLDHDDVKNVVLALDPMDATNYDSESDPIKGNMHCNVDGSSPLRFYATYLFANPLYGWDKLSCRFNMGYLVDASHVYISETGVYNKQVRDSTRIGGMAEYLALENNRLPTAPLRMDTGDEALNAVREIVSLCRDNGVRLFVIGVPLYYEDLEQYDRAEMSRFWTGVAEITEFYDFWGYYPLCNDLRYFYDTDHFRNDVGRMVLARVFGDGSVYVPDDFGHITNAENVRGHISALYDPAAAASGASDLVAAVPVLMYHAFTEDAGKAADTFTLSGDFADQLASLCSAGYKAVSLEQLIDYVENGTALPERPIVITIDDGYRDNLTIAAPILEEYGCSADIFVIGCSVGKDTYKDTGEAIIPHFSLEEAHPWVEKGVVRIQPHSYDMHQTEQFDGADRRLGVLIRADESETQYVSALTQDYLRCVDLIESALDEDCTAFSYPYGMYDNLSEIVLRSLGVKVTLSTKEGVNEILKGLPQSLIQLRRIDVSGGTSGSMLLERLDDLLSQPR